MSNILINFIGKTDELKPVENVLEDIKAKGGEVGQAWGKASDAMKASTKKITDELGNATKAATTLEKSIIGGTYADKLKQLQVEISKFSKLGVDGAKQLTTQLDALIAKENQLKAAIANATNPELLAGYNTGLVQTREQISLVSTALDALQPSGSVFNEFNDTEPIVQAETKIVSLRSQLMKMKTELGGMQEGTAEFIALEKQAAAVEQRMKTMNKTISEMAKGNTGIAGMVSLIGGVAGAFAAAQGAAALFGDQNEETAKAMQKVMGAMSLLQGIQQISETINKESAASIALTNLIRKKEIVDIGTQAAGTEVLAGAEIEQAAATDAATASQVGLNAAMLANPVGLVIAGIAALVGVFSLLDYTLNEDNRELEKQAKNLKTNHDGMVLLNDITNKSYLDKINNQKNLNTISNASGSKDEQRLKNEKLLQDAKLELANKNYDTFKKDIDNLDTYNKQLFEAQSKVNDLISKQDKAPGALKGGLLNMLTGLNERAKITDYVKTKGEYDDEIKPLQSFITSIKAIYDNGTKFNDEKNDAQVASDAAALEKKRKIWADELNAFITNEEAKVLATVSGSDAERNAQINEIKHTQSARITLAKQSAASEVEANAAANKIIAEDNRQVTQLSLQNYQHYLKGKTALEESYIAQAKIAQINNQVDSIASIKNLSKLEIEAEKDRYNEANSNPTLNKGEKLKLKKEYLLKVKELKKQNQLEILDIEKSGINARLILTAKDSDDEYNTKIELIKKEQQIELAAIKITKEKKAEINAKYKEEIHQLSIKKNIAELDDDISLLDIQLSAFGVNEKDKLTLTLKRLDDEKNKEIEAADGNGIKIGAIVAKYEKQIRETKLASIDTIAKHDLEVYQANAHDKIRYNEGIISDQNSTVFQKENALNDLLAEKEAEFKILYDANEEKKGLDENYENNRTKLLNNQADFEDAIQKQITDVQLKEIDKRLSKIKSVFDFYQKGLDSVLDTSAVKTALSEFQNVFTSISESISKLNVILRDPNTTPEQAAAARLKAFTEEVKAVLQMTQSVINQIFADSSAKRQQILADDIAALENQKTKELDNKNLTEQQKADINAKYLEKERQAKTRAFIADKEAKKQQSIINGALAIVGALTTQPIWLGLVMAGIVAASTAVEVAKINSTPVPKFRHGKIDIQGAGTTTSDSIPAMISKGESVIKADSTAKWKDALTAINNDKFEHYLTNKYSDFVFPKVPDYVIAGSQQKEINYDKLAEAVANKMAGIIPSPSQVHNNMDADSIRTFLINGSTKTEIKNKYFSMTS